MNCQNCYWYIPQAEGSGCVLGHESSQEDCEDVYEDWELLAKVSPMDPRLHDKQL